ncbi:MAG: hypothetical protein JNK15_14130 [Planctomycetes bacterium]|nr:hypothetical protein [Planctomycetota bacterium]
MHPSQAELLQIAFDAASAFPIDPHGKNRSRAQEVVVVACFELGQPDLALGYGTRIADWRRGIAYADYAFGMARRGDAQRAREYIALAQGVIAEEKAVPESQAWRSDLIALKCARAFARLGDDAAATTAAAGIDAASAHAVDGGWADTAADRVERITEQGVAAELAAIDEAFPAMSIGQQSVALATLARVHAKFFSDATTRRFCEERVAERWVKLMPGLRLEALATMVQTCFDRKEIEAGRKLLAVMREIVAAHTWRPEDKAPWTGRLVELTFAGGETERAKADADAALAAWHRDREQVVNIWRAETLRPLALAFHALGDTTRCDELLGLVLEESLENPNSRPRCDDLVDTCVDLARRAIVPSAAVLDRIREIQRGLKAPW